MSRYLLLASLGLGALAPAGAVWAAELYGIKGPPEVGTDYYLGVVDGEARLVKTGTARIDWEFVRTDKGTLIRVSSSPVGKWYGWYLGYDPEGKSKAIVVLKKPGPNCYWSVGRNTLEGQEPYTTSFDANGGPLDGYILSVGDKAEELKDKRGKPYTAYRVVLSPNPGRIPRFYVFEIAP